MEESAAKVMLIEAGKWICDQGLTWGTSGNLSMRLDEAHMLVTARGTQLGALREDSFALCTLTGERVVGGIPSKEAPIHAGVYAHAPWAHAIVHASPLHATLAACSDLAVPNHLYVENMYDLQRVARVPYAHPGSKALSEATAQAAARANVLLLENHGVLIYEEKLSGALSALETLENTCHMALCAAQAGVHLHCLSEETREDFLSNSGYRPLRTWPR